MDLSGPELALMESHGAKIHIGSHVYRFTLLSRGGAFKALMDWPQQSID